MKNGMEGVALVQRSQAPSLLLLQLFFAAHRIDSNTIATKSNLNTTARRPLKVCLDMPPLMNSSKFAQVLRGPRR